MARDFGPWVRLDWCPTCCASTEQSRWHSYVAPGSPLNGLKVRCNVCLQAVPLWLGDEAASMATPAEPLTTLGVGSVGGPVRGRHAL